MTFRLLPFFILGLFHQALSKENRPNIIFVLADDLGWAELGCYGNTFHETPHLDQLAKEGVRFTHAYAAAPVCSPYRAALLTGQHPARVGILDYLRPNSSNALPVSQVTLPKMLRHNGYSTGMVGKWHLTGYKYQNAQFEIRPKDHGFSWNIGSEIKGVGNGANFWPYVFRTQPISWIDLPKNRLGENEYLTDRLNFEAVEFVERNKDKPFFLYLSHYAPHTILNGRPDLVAKYRRKKSPGKSKRTNCYLCKDAGLDVEHCEHWSENHNPHLGAMLESIDDGIGLLTRKLDDLGISDNTIFIFSSDNGGETNVTSNEPLRGGKSQLYEGGIRVPLIVRWPRGKVPSGESCSQPVVNHDFYPTLLEAARIEPDSKQKLDGISILSTWQNPAKPTKRDSLHWHYPLDRPHFLGGVSSGAIRKNDYKLIEYFDPARPQKFELFNLKKDPSEKNDLSNTNPNLVKKLHQELLSWREKTGARIPSRPLLTESRNLLWGEHFSAGQISPNWFFQKEWEVKNGRLLRNQIAGDNKRLFYKEPNFKDALLRFEFRFDGAEDIRLVTGSNGGYNTVLHIQKNHFLIQTAYDPDGPFYPMRHGECAYNFKDGKWYVMTIEFLGDQVVAHLDHQNIAFGQHPIIQKERTYFAFQVDRAGASFDNVQVFQVGRNPHRDKNLSLIGSEKENPSIQRTPKEEYQILKQNLHAKLHMTDPTYRALVEQVDLLDQEKVEKFPEVFTSHKSFQKKTQALRKKLHKEDPKYKEMLFATFRAKRALDEFLIGKNPEIEGLPEARSKAVLEETRIMFSSHPEYVRLVEHFEDVQKALESQYPQLFITNQEITQKRNQAREEVKEKPDFKKLTKKRSDAYNAQQNYLYQKNKKLVSLKNLSK